MDVCKRIVVPVSFNKASVHAIGEALFLAQKNAAEVVLVHVNTESTKTERYFDEEFRKIITNYGELAHHIDVSWRIIPGKKNNIVSQFAKTVDQLEPLFMVVGYDVKSKYSLGPNIKDIVYKTNYPVIALKSGETVRELNTILYPLTLEPNSRQKTNISIKLAKDLDLKIALFPMRLDNTKRDDKEEHIIVNQLTSKFTENKVEHSVEWADG
jgi:hypothetical protein